MRTLTSLAAVVLMGSVALPRSASAIELAWHPKHLLQEVTCLAEGVYREARGEGTMGMVAVGNVVRNRTQDGSGRGFCDVIFERHGYSCQFSWVCHHAALPADSAVWRKSMAIAAAVVDDAVPDVTNGATSFHRCQHAPGRAGHIGSQCFFGEEGEAVHPVSGRELSIAVVDDESADYGYRVVVNRYGMKVEPGKNEEPVEVASAPGQDMGR